MDITEHQYEKASLEAENYKPKRKYLAWDIETASWPPEGEKWQDHAPLGISCAATLATGQEEPIVWYAGQFFNDAEPIPGGMEKRELVHMLNYMDDMTSRGFKIVTWNGLGFDFECLGYEIGDLRRCGHMAMNHIDMMWHFFAVKGFPVGLAKVAEGLSLGGKVGMTGADAPAMWNGTLDDREAVLKYVSGDAQLTLDIAEEVDKSGRVTWVTQRGKYSSAKVGEWLTVQQALALPEPDNSWMDNPISRDQFLKWVKEADAYDKKE